MNISALLFIILAFWIFVLQSKIKHLEKLVYGLKSKEPYFGIAETQNRSITEDNVMENETVDAEDTVEMLTEEEYIKKIKEEAEAEKEPEEIIVFMDSKKNFITIRFSPHFPEQTMRLFGAILKSFVAVT